MIDPNMTDILKGFDKVVAPTADKPLTEINTPTNQIESPTNNAAMQKLLEGLDSQQTSVNQMPATHKMAKNTATKHPASKYLVGGEFEDDGQEIEEDIDSARSVAIELKQMYDMNEKNVQQIMAKSGDPYNTLMYVLYPGTADIDGTREYNEIVDNLTALMNDTESLEEDSETISKLRDSYNGWEVREWPTHWGIRKPGKSKNEVYATGARSYVMRKWKELKARNTIKESKPVDNFTADDLQQLGAITDLGAMKQRAMELIGNQNSTRPMKPEKVQWFRGQMERKTNANAIIKMMWDLLLAGEGNKVVGSGTSMGKSSYDKTFEADGDSLVTTWDEVSRAKRSRGKRSNRPDLAGAQFEPATTDCPTCQGNGYTHSGSECEQCDGVGEIHEDAVQEQLSPKLAPKQAMNKKQSFKDIFKSMDEEHENMETRFKRELHDEMQPKALTKGDNDKFNLAEASRSPEMVDLQAHLTNMAWFGDSIRSIEEEFRTNNGDTFLLLAKKIVTAVTAVRTTRGNG